MSPWNREVHLGEIDGVPTVWAEAPGPLRASLMFRVGKVDERLPWSGITHLVEHLALFQLGPKQDYEFNGAVTPNRTMFYASGTPADVVAFLSHVASSLANLPLERAEAEKSVLRAEAASRPLSAGDALFNLRYGARGYGLYRYPELALEHVPPEWITRWSSLYFTRDNAVLWLSGPPPAGLHVALPAGKKMSYPRVEPLPLSLPAYAHAAVPGAGVAMLAPRSTALALASSITSARLMQRLRYDKGIAYAVQGGYLPLDVQSAHVMFWTDAQQGQAANVLNETVQAIYAMGTQGPSAEELSGEANSFEHSFDRDEAPLAWLDRTAVRLLNGEPAEHPADLVAEMKAVTPAEARDAMAAALQTAIYLGPNDVPPPAALRSYARTPARPIQGHVLPHVSARSWRNPPTLTVGGDGVTMLVNSNEQYTVRFDACEAVLRHGDGGIAMFGSDGVSLPLNATEWANAPWAVQQILQTVPAEMVVPMLSDKTARVIEVPQNTAAQRQGLTGVPIERWIGLFVFVAVGVALLLFAISGRVGTGPPVVSLVAWGVLGWRVLRRLM